MIQALFLEIRQVPQLVSRSAKELRKVGSLTGTAMLAALNVITNQFTIILSATLQIGFSFLTVGVSGMLYGPVLTGLVGVATDLIKYMLLSNGGFFPGFTLNEFIIGFLYGIFLYQKPVSWKRIIAAQLCVTLVINLFLTPLWLSIMYGKAFWVLVAGRLLKNVLLFPIDVALLYFVAKTTQVRHLDAVR